MDEILVEVAGPGVTPENVAARELLRLAYAYVDALVRVAREETDEEIAVTGLAVIQKCAAVRVFTDKPAIALESGEAIQGFLKGRGDPPRGIAVAVGQVKRAIEDLPPTYRSAVRFHEAGRERVLHLVIEKPDVVLPPHEVVELRAKPIRAGGSKPVARFEARTEPKAFTLIARDWDVVRQIGAALLKPCDIVAKVARDEEGGISTGKLIEFSPADPDSAGAWERWYRDNRDALSLDPDRGGLDD